MTVYMPIGEKPYARSYRNIMCDFRGGRCPAVFEGKPGERVWQVRGLARQSNWFCQNSGPGHPALDLCPQHRESRP